MKAEVLTPEAVERFFEDLAFETSVLGILVQEPSVVGDGPPTLREARKLFLSGGAKGLQVRYVHCGVEWWDTLMHTNAGARIVRVRK
jgi:hypothetical protein